MGERFDVVVVGGGLVGLAAGWRLAQRGVRVAVVERYRVGRAAARAAAAMIAPVGYVEPPDAFLRLRVDGAARWPGFATELAEATGIDPRYQVTGSLVAAMAPGDLDRLRALRRFHGELGIDSALLDTTQARQVEPALTAEAAGALHVPGEGCVDPERVAQALLAATTDAGGEVFEDRPVLGLRTTGDRVTGVATPLGDILAGSAVVLAAGAWSAQLPGIPEPARPPLQAVKGQSIVVSAQLGTVVRAGVNLVPRGDGRVMLAGTVEPGAALDDTEATVAGLRFVLAEAVRAVPALAGARFVEHAVGLRPVGPDDAPILGPSPVDGLWWATGHSYYGILLAPITADLVAGALTGDRDAGARLDAFGAGRFAAGRPAYTSLAH
jgi:glycine oxidase